MRKPGRCFLQEEGARRLLENGFLKRVRNPIVAKPKRPPGRKEGLRRCPFCGERGVVTRTARFLNSVRFRVCCSDDEYCDTWGPIGHSRAEAIYMWNGRA